MRLTFSSSRNRWDHPEELKAPLPGRPILSSRGFALIASLLTIFLLSAMGILVFTVTTQDVRISTRVIGQKKAFSAAETGIHQLMQTFDPDNLAASQVSHVPVDPMVDPQSEYSISTASLPTRGPETLPLAGYSMAGGQQWGQNRYSTSVVGNNTRYASSVQIDVNVGFGPIEILTTYR